MNKSTEVILRNVKNIIGASRTVSCGDTVIVGVSGGPDSVALLHILTALRHELGLSLHVAHFNHGWRKSAKRDEDFVRRLAGAWGLPCSCVRVSRRLVKTATSLEERGREQRLQFFQRLAKKIHARAILLGHTQDDLVETVLMHILRGSGLQGMRGILAHRQIQGTHLIRPLLGMTKRDILEYLKRKGIRHRQDPTNQRAHFFRNRIRLELLPLLEKKYNFGIRTILANLADTASADYDYLEGEAKRVFERMAKYVPNKGIVRLNRKALMRQPEAIKRMLVRLAVERVQSNMNRLTLAHMRAIEDILSQENICSIVHFPGRIRVRVGESYLDVSGAGAPPQ